MRPRVLVIGLDGLQPALTFERYRPFLPCLSELMEQGVWGRLGSGDPPDATPAGSGQWSSRWASMLSGYGAAQLEAPRPPVWDHLGAAGFSSGLVGVPDTLPPRPLVGFWAAAFRASDPGVACTYPDAVAGEVEDLLGDYPRDLDGPDAADPERVLAAVRLTTEQHFALFRHLLRRRGGDFVMLCEPGPARLHHVLGPDREPIIADYYAELDEEVARTLHRVDAACHVLVVSVGSAAADRDEDGVFIYRGPPPRRAGPRPGLRLVDVGPTILGRFGLAAPADAAGRPMSLE